MKRNLVILIAVLLTVGFTSGRRGLLLNRGASDACSSCTNETFEGTGYAVAGWTESGDTADEDYTTAPAPLAGSQSLVIRNAAFATAFASIDMPSSGEGWMRFKVCFTNTIVDTWFVAYFLNNAGGGLASLRINSGGLRVEAGGAPSATTVATLSAGTTYNVWFHYAKGSGANAVADVGFSTSSVRPTSGDNFAQVTTGTSTADTLEWWLGGGDATFGGAYAGAIYDSVSFSTTGAIGNF